MCNNVTRLLLDRCAPLLLLAHIHMHTDVHGEGGRENEESPCLPSSLPSILPHLVDGTGTFPGVSPWWALLDSWG